MRAGHLIAVAVLAVVNAAPAVTTGGTSDDQARDAYDKGTELFQDGDYAGAARAFRRANELKPNWKILYNVGQAEAAAKHHGLALEAFERYLAEGGDDIAAARRDEVLEEVRRLRDMVGALKVDAPDGSLVIVDGIERGRTPLSGTLMVAAGIEHSVSITQGDQTVLERTVKVSGGQILVVGSGGEGVEAAGATAGAEDTGATDDSAVGAGDVAGGDDGPSSGLRIAGWVAVGTGAALLIGGGVTGGLALSMNGDLADECGDGSCSQADKGDEVDKRDGLATASSVLLGVGGAVAATGIVLLIVDAVKGEEPSAAAAKGYDIGCAPALGPQFTGAMIEGRF